MSIWDADRDMPLMHAGEGEQAGPYGLASWAQRFMAGMMALCRELSMFIAPNVNSYKRYASLAGRR